MLPFSYLNVIFCNHWVCAITASCDGSVRMHIDGIFFGSSPYLFYLRRLDQTEVVGQIGGYLSCLGRDSSVGRGDGPGR